MASWIMQNKLEESLLQKAMFRYEWRYLKHFEKGKGRTCIGSHRESDLTEARFNGRESIDGMLRYILDDITGRMF